MKRYRLRNLRLTRVDRVPAGSNPESHIVLFKAADGLPTTDSTLSDIQPSEVSVPDTNETPEDVTKHTESLKDQLAAALAERDEARASVDALTAAAAEVVVELDSEIEQVVEPELEPVAMSDLRKSLEDAQGEIAKMKHDARVAEFIAKAKTDFGNIGTADEVGGMLLAIADVVPAETYQTLERTLKATNAQLGSGDLFKQVGNPNAEPAEVEDQITAAAKVLVDNGEAKNIGLAKMEVLKRNPELREAYESARRA